MKRQDAAAQQPRTKFLRPFTTHVINPITRLVAGHLPGFAIVRHRGRRSGRLHRTPMNVFRDGDDWIFALTYGSDVQWVQNVLAAGGAELEVRGKLLHLVDPTLFVDPRRRLMPLPVRFLLGFIRVSEFLRMHPAPKGGPAPTARAEYPAPVRTNRRSSAGGRSDAPWR